MESRNAKGWAAWVGLAILLVCPSARAQDALGPAFRIPPDVVGRIAVGPDVFVASDTAAMVAWRTRDALSVRLLTPTEAGRHHVVRTGDGAVNVVGAISTDDVGLLAWSSPVGVHWASVRADVLVADPMTIPIAAGAMVSVWVTMAGERGVVAWTA